MCFWGERSILSLLSTSPSRWDFSQMGARGQTGSSSNIIGPRAVPELGSRTRGSGNGAASYWHGEEEEEDSGGLVNKRAHSGSIESNGYDELNTCMRNYEDSLWSTTWSWIPETSLALTVHELFLVES